MKTKHTPGPWVIKKSKTVLKYEIIRSQMPQCSGLAWHEAESEANARLIAAAPELLDALTSLLNYENLGAYERADAVKAARAAIAKATGGQP